MKYLYLISSLIWILIGTSTLNAAGASNADDRPNIIFILVDDMGWSDIGAYGGEIDTPNIDRLADQGIRFTQFYNAAKCNTSRAALLTGIHAQQSDMMKHKKIRHAVTLGEVLQPAGYRTLASGKHHSQDNLFDRGFDHYYGLRDGGSNFWNPGEQRPGEPVPGSKGRVRVWCDDEKVYEPYTPEDKDFYVTDAFTNKALEWLEEEADSRQPFFLYLAYTAPHYPLHAWPEDIAKYKGKYDAGYRAIQEARYERMVQMGLIDPEKYPLPKWNGDDWDKLSGVELEKEKLRMEIYAAMLDRVDQNLGRVFDLLEAQGKLDNTLIMFASDNGACAEPANAKVHSTKLEDFGKLASFETVGESWASVQNTPLLKWKNYSHEGGSRTPFIVSWPARIKDTGGFNDQVGHFIDIMPTLIELTGASYPENFNGESITPMQGISLMPALEGQSLNREEPLFFQWSRGGAIRDGNYKAVFWGRGPDSWELYDMSQNLNETDNLAKKMPEKLDTMKAQWKEWYSSLPYKR